jgi:serine/threonine protein kinase
MPAHATTVTDYCGILSRSRLIPEADVRALHDKWKAETQGSNSDVEQFRRYLVQRKCLTEYQAALVQRGHTEGFFIGGYTILDRIGKGASAGVYKAVHTSGQVVALKVLPASKARDPHALNRFQREGRLLTQLDHPNVVRAFQVGQSGNVHFIVMEHLDGETLDDVVGRRKKLPPPEAVRLVQQALFGLQHLHDRKMVHRDLKPSNLMVTSFEETSQQDTTLNSTVKVLDIGIGREMFDEGASPRRDAEVTAVGAILGTPDYLAPEQARDARSSDVRADIYSLGCVLFHLIAGRTPFDEKNVMAQVLKHAIDDMPPLPAVPPGLQDVFARMTAKRVEDRYQTPAAAAAALAPFLPASASAAMSSQVLPAYKEFLETESQMELEANMDELLAAAAAKAPPPAATAPTVPALPPLPPPAPVPAKPVAKASGAKPVPIKPAPPPPPSADEIDVELVDPPSMSLTPSSISLPAHRAPLYPHTRRDFLMMGVGAGGVLLAIGIGFGLAQLMRKPEPPPDPPK